MSGTPPPPTLDPDVEVYLRLFYPQYFDPTNPNYVDPNTMAALSVIAADSRPWCLPDDQQDLAQAFFTAYLVSVQRETSTGQGMTRVSGPVTSEREGDIAVTYADLTKTGSSGASGMSGRPPSDAWDAWNRLWLKCGRGSITSRFGDPVRRSSAQITTEATLRVVANGSHV